MIMCPETSSLIFKNLKYNDNACNPSIASSCGSRSYYLSSVLINLVSITGTEDMACPGDVCKFNAFGDYGP